MPVIPQQLKAAITRFDAAAQALAYKGAAAPEDQHAIVHQHERARELLENAIQKALNQ